MHVYTSRVAWSGSTAVGYEGYDRRHSGLSPAGFSVPLSSDSAFRGDPACLNPEELLVLAAASCQLLSFLAVAARARLDVVEYRDEAVGEMSELEPTKRPARMALTHITLRPQITVTQAPELQVSEKRILHLCEVAHRECYIANSLRTEVLVIPTVTMSPVPAAL